MGRAGRHHEAVRADAEERMSGRFVDVDRDTAYLLPPSVQAWLPEDHLARFVVEIVEGLDLGPLTRAYGGRGSDAFPPAMMVALLFYGYATGRLFESPAGAGDVRLGGDAVRGREPASGPRYDCALP